MRDISQSEVTDARFKAGSGMKGMWMPEPAETQDNSRANDGWVLAAILFDPFSLVLIAFGWVAVGAVWLLAWVA